MGSYMPCGVGAGEGGRSGCTRCWAGLAGSTRLATRRRSVLERRRGRRVDEANCQRSIIDCRALPRVVRSEGEGAAGTRQSRTGSVTGAFVRFGRVLSWFGRLHAFSSPVLLKLGRARKGRDEQRERPPQMSQQEPGWRCRRTGARGVARPARKKDSMYLYPSCRPYSC
jgi:hypothetical protein